MKTSITFFGTPEFAVPALKALIKAPFCDVTAVVTQPDKPIGRHHSKPVPSPVKKVALENGIDVITPRHSGGLSTSLQNDGQLGVLVAYGEIIPQELINAFPLGILNIHPSLLPKYRGSSPIQAAILNQDKETGVTLMNLDNKMDHGPIVAQERLPLPPGEGWGEGPTAGDLHDALSKLGAELLINTLPDYIAGKIQPKPQDHTKASYTEKLTKQGAKINWQQTAHSIEPFIRAMNPWPGAWTTWNNKKLIIWSMEPDGTPREVQLEGKNKMPFKEFLKGHPNFEIPNR